MSSMSDVNSFVKSHPAYQYTKDTYCCAMLSVGDIRNTTIVVEGERLNVNVEVEPRTARVASHAGIFTRVGSTNIKKGSTIPAEALPLGISADDILMELGWSLISISSIVENSLLLEGEVDD